MIERYEHLHGINIYDHDTKPELAVHVIIGASDYARIKTNTRARIGAPGEPVAEETRFGWTIISPGRDMALVIVVS